MVDFGKLLASRLSVASVTLIALQSTFYVVPLYTLTVGNDLHTLTVLDDWHVEKGHVIAPP